MELVIAGILKDELEDDSERIVELSDWVVNNGPDLEGLDEMQVHDSESNAEYGQVTHTQTDISSQSTINRKALPAETYSYLTNPTTRAESLSLLSIPSSIASSMQTSFHIHSSAYSGPNSKTARIPIKILVVDDNLTHVGPMFKKYLKNLTAQYFFGPEPPRQCESTVPLEAIPQAWRPNFEIDLCAASPGVRRPTKGPDAISRKHLKKRLRKYENLQFKENTFQDSKGKRPHLYDYILFVHQYYYKDSPRRNWLQTAPFDDTGASEPILDTRADVDYGDGVTSLYSTIYVGALSTSAKVFEILEFFSEDPDGPSKKGPEVWTKHIVLPDKISADFMDRCFGSVEKNSFTKARQQIEDGVRRFIKIELRGKDFHQAPPEVPPVPRARKYRSMEASEVAPLIPDIESA